MGDGIDPVVINGIISSLFALLLLWLKSTMDSRMGEMKEKLSVSNANLSNLSTQLNNLNFTLTQIATKVNVTNIANEGDVFRPREQIYEAQNIEVKEEAIGVK